MHPMADFRTEKQLGWFEHMQRRDKYEATRKISQMTVDGKHSTLFLTPFRFLAFHLICPAFLAFLELEKMRSMRSAQRQVELRRLGNQLQVLGKANSLCKVVKCCVFCLRLSSGRVGPESAG